MHQNSSELKSDDWWETIFKPNFSIKECRDILDLSYDTNSDSSLTLPSDEVENFKTVKQVSENIDKDQNIYRQTWREQRFSLNEFPKLQMCLSEGYINKLAQKETKCATSEASTQTKECIWNSKEIKIIRSCIKEFKNKDMKLMAEVKELTNRNEGFDAKLKLLEKKLTKKTEALNEALKANNRFHILSETLSNQLDDAKQRNSSINSQKSELLDKLSNLQLSVASLTQEIASKESELNNLQTQLDKLESKYKHEMKISLSELEKKHDKEINVLQVKLSNISGELSREKVIHKATEVGFQQLLKHFSEKPASLSTQKNPVDITSIKYTNI